MKKHAFLLYGLVCYAIFFGTFLYAIGFLGNFIVSKSIDSGEAGATTPSLIINVILLSLFAVPHSVMARPAFKKAWTKIVPEPMERSTYVLQSSLLLILLFWQWRPMTGVIWDVADQPVAPIFWAFFASGWALVLFATFLIDHFDLFGLRQTWVYWQGKEYESKPFGTPSLYKYMRHPLYLGWFLAFWATPSMTTGHLLFAIVTTAYIHDLGMFLSPEVREARLKPDSDLWRELEIDDEIAQEFDKLRTAADDDSVSQALRDRARRRLNQAEEALLAKDTRERHATQERYEDILAELQAAHKESPTKIPTLDACFSFDGDSRLLPQFYHPS